MVIILIPYVTFFKVQDPTYFLVPFTNWTLILTTIALIMSIRAIGLKQYSRHAFCGKVNDEAFGL